VKDLHVECEQCSIAYCRVLLMGEIVFQQISAQAVSEQCGGRVRDIGGGQLLLDGMS
jgi:hypothetical protein